MAWTATDLANIEEAIRALVAGSRTVSLTMGDKSIAYEKSDLAALIRLRDGIKYEVGLAAGTYSPRTYAKQGGRCR